MEEKFLDIENLLKTKNPKVYRWTPRFLLKYLKRKLHEDEVNQFIHETKGFRGYQFADKAIRDFDLKLEYEGVENIPKSGGVIFAMNHPLGGMDAMAMILKINEIRDDYKFVVNDILLNLKDLNDIFVGVTKHGTNTKKSLEELNELFASEMAIFVFPAGLVSRKKKGVIEDLEWKKTFISRSKKFEKDVIPVHIDGELRNFFYRLSNFRSAIGIKANIEMLYLIDELYKQKNKTIRISFGKKIDHKTFDKSKKDIEWAQWVKQKAYALKSNANE